MSKVIGPSEFSVGPIVVRPSSAAITAILVWMVVVIVKDVVRPENDDAAPRKTTPS